MKQSCDFNSLDGTLQQSGGVFSLRMGDLRDAFGAGKLGKHIRAAISDELENRGIGYVPNPLPVNQHEYVRLYLRGTPAAEVIEAVTAIGDPDADEILRRLHDQTPTERVGASRRWSSSREGSLLAVVRCLHRAESRPNLPFVGLKWFRDVALREEDVAWPNGDGDRDAVLREAIERGLVLTGKVPNPHNPQHPVTSVRLNRAAPEVKAALANTQTIDGRFGPPVFIRNGPLSETILRDRR